MREALTGRTIAMCVLLLGTCTCMPPPNQERLQRSCEENIWTACLALGRLYMKRCDAGQAEDCCLAARYYDLSREERKRAPELLEKGCDGNAGACCAALGASRLFGTDVGTEENAGAAALLEKACDLGDLAGCERLALANANGEVGPPNRMRATELAHTACKGGRRSACDLERWYYEKMTQ